MISSITLSVLCHGFRPVGEDSPAFGSPWDKTAGIRTVLLMTRLMTGELAWTTHVWFSGVPEIHGLPPETLLECFSLAQP